jgi:N-acetylglucosamine kinase-like BadF-type ATPase|tara:strand:+ start:381 stop:641 length:261 start_codon:yes stop_codon:yes gene_type:complete
MLKEIKYLIFIVIISLFIFFTGKYYFSDENIKKSYRSYKNIDEKTKIYSKNLPILENNTKDVIEFIKQTNKKKKKKFNFWKLLEND